MEEREKEKEIKSMIEAMLFIWGDPLSAKNIADALNLPTEYIRKCVLELKRDLETEDRGIQIIEINNNFQMCTNSRHFEAIQALCTPAQNKGLTQAALEVLAIIAYKQPITRHEIEAIRGVKSDKAINTLIEKGLIIENGRLEKTGRPILYGTTDNFLKSFGLSSLKELPEVSEFDKLDFQEIMTPETEA
ncbi:SMC-Scp complex subunit ScpB [Geosporobacter ferrireducens]|nr:SMC-Scp complex subunit ScpB [Geosporobacter ferrireducens]